MFKGFLSLVSQYSILTKSASNLCRSQFIWDPNYSFKWSEAKLLHSCFAFRDVWASWDSCCSCSDIAWVWQRMMQKCWFWVTENFSVSILAFWFLSSHCLKDSFYWDRDPLLSVPILVTFILDFRFLKISNISIQGAAEKPYINKICWRALYESDIILAILFQHLYEGNRIYFWWHLKSKEILEEACNIWILVIPGLKSVDTNDSWLNSLSISLFS